MRRAFAVCMSCMHIDPVLCDIQPCYDKKTMSQSRGHSQAGGRVKMRITYVQRHTADRTCADNVGDIWTYTSYTDAPTRLGHGWDTMSSPCHHCSCLARRRLQGGELIEPDCHCIGAFRTVPSPAFWRWLSERERMQAKQRCRDVESWIMVIGNDSCS